MKELQRTAIRMSKHVSQRNEDRTAGAIRGVVTSRSSWASLKRAHDDEVQAFAAAAQAVPEALWLLPRAEGKWSCAEIVEHVTLGFEVMAGELRGGPGMAMRLRGLKRLVARHLYGRRIMRGGGLPTGARAPRETRPAEHRVDRTTALVRLRASADELMGEIERALAERPAVTVQHAYFGRLSLREGAMLSMQHVRHHRAQMEAGGAADSLEVLSGGRHT